MRPQINSEPKKRGPVPTVKALLLLLVLLFLFVCFFFFVFGSVLIWRKGCTPLSGGEGRGGLEGCEARQRVFPIQGSTNEPQNGCFPLGSL